jgi:hypothetical protein
MFIGADEYVCLFGFQFSSFLVGYEFEDIIANVTSVCHDFK